MNTRTYGAIQNLVFANRQICSLVAFRLFIDSVLGMLATQIRLAAKRPGVVAGPSLSLGNTHGCFFTVQVWRQES